jgi:hypothetical protein
MLVSGMASDGRRFRHSYRSWLDDTGAPHARWRCLFFLAFSKVGVEMTPLEAAIAWI